MHGPTTARSPLAIFDEALDLDPAAERAAYLDRACAGDPALRARVEALLEVHARAGSFLESPAVAPTIDGIPPAAAERPETVIGPYRLLEPIGEGGMGTVYMAEQVEPVRRRVALKVIKPGMDSKQVVARFEAERQALALMDHPNIARVFDGGLTPSGRPYFVMELVRGLPITEYCDREQLTITERLELFVLVCRAVQHAHQKGVIHRDLKPSNILVTVIDGVAVPKVIDFGVAKATGPALTERTLFTGFHQFVGTPLYVSPEQAALSGVDVDTRSDIYSLGVLLYELLTGTTPFEAETLRQAAFDEMRRIIREEDPPRPSERLSTLDETLTTVSARRKADPKRLGSSLRGELDWVVMKALEKDRGRRYETASDFAADILRYLTDRPVAACPPSTSYLVAKYARRHRAAITTALLVSASLVTGLVLTTRQAARATAARLQAEEHLTEGLQAVDELYDHVAAHGLTELLGSPLPRPFLLKVLPFYERFTAERRVDAASGRAHRRIGEILMQLRRFKEAGAALDRSEAIGRALVAVDPDRPAHLRDLAACLADRGELPAAGGGRPEPMREAMDLRRRLAERFPEVAAYRRELAESAHALAKRYAWRREPAGRPYLDTALMLRKRLVEEFPNDPDLLCDLGTTNRLLAEFHCRSGRQAEAMPYARRAYEIHGRLLEEHPTDPRYMQHLAWDCCCLGGALLEERPDDPEATRMFERAVTISTGLASDHPDQPGFHDSLLGALGGQAILLSRIGDQAKLDQTTRRLVGQLDRWGDTGLMCHTAWSLCQSNIRAHAAPEVALELAREAHRRDPADSLRNHVLGQALFRGRRWDEAIDAFIRTNELEKGTYFCCNGFWVAMAYHHKGDPARARSWYDRSIVDLSERRPNDANAIRYREEAAALLGLTPPG